MAAFWVVFHHFAPSILAPSGFLAVGYTAVDLFFILSGLILSSVHSDLPSDGVGAFWLKRICRVYPAHVSSLLILTAVVSALTGGGPSALDVEPRRLTIRLATVALTLVASALSYEFVERPGRRMPALLAGRRLRTAPSCPR